MPAPVNRSFHPEDDYNTHFSRANMVHLLDSKTPKTNRTILTDGSEWSQKCSQSAYIIHGEGEDLVEKKKKFEDDEINRYDTNPVELNEEGIKMGIERRIQLYFLQAILCYKMSMFTFSTTNANLQIGSSKHMYLGNGKGRKKYKREAAHSSTLPNLIATTKDGYSFIYLDGTSYHFYQNSTIGMHESVNGADELIDGKVNDGKLRDKALALINRIANGLDPVDATREFISEFISVCTSTLDKFRKDKRGKVLEKYIHYGRQFQEMAKSSEFFDRLLDIPIMTGKYEDVIRELVYKKRYDIILKQQVVENYSLKLIEKFQKDTGMKKNEKRFLQFALMDLAKKDEKRIFQKLFCKTNAYFEESYLDTVDDKKKKAYLKSFNTQFRNFKEKYKPLLNDLLRDLREVFRDLQRDEMIYRAAIFKSLRTANNWNTKRFLRKI